jgi:hypothetical protein
MREKRTLILASLNVASVLFLIFLIYLLIYLYSYLFRQNQACSEFRDISPQMPTLLRAAGAAALEGLGPRLMNACTTD